MTSSGTVFELPAPGEALPATLARFREAGPVVRVELPGGVRVWAATSFAAVREVLSADGARFGKHFTHWAALRDGEVPADWPFLQLVYGEHMLMRDGADHRRLRGVVARDFTPSRVGALAPRVSEIVAELLDGVVAAGQPVDLVPTFTEQLPMAVISELLGIPVEERSSLRGWTQVLFSIKSTPEQAQVAGGELLDYLGRLVERKRQHPGDDLVSAMVRGQADEQLSMRELVDCLFLMIIAGHETTVHLLGQAVIALLANPGQLEQAIAEDRWDDVVEETLRRTPPVYDSLFRYALEDTELAGVPIAAGDAVLLSYGSASTDPAEYGPDAAEFDINRERHSHLAFGHGPHFCLGAPLARLEGRIALAALFRRLPDLKIAIPFDEIPYSPSFLTYGPLSVPVLTE